MEKQIKEYWDAKKILEILFSGDHKLHFKFASSVTIEEVQELRFTVDYYEGKFLHD